MVRCLLYIVVFVSGAVLMGLEIIGSRVLAPYFGSSIFVWGSLISVVMTALSVGYYWGGWLSAREPSYGRLPCCCLFPVMIFFSRSFTVAQRWIAGIDFGNRLNPLIACSIYFLPPGIFSDRFSLRHRLARRRSTRWAAPACAISTCGSILARCSPPLSDASHGVSNIIHALGITLACLASLCRWCPAPSL
jgi:hypothetical protein